jgi:hypothetical protein
VIAPLLIDDQPVRALVTKNRYPQEKFVTGTACIRSSPLVWIPFSTHGRR